MQMIVCVLIHQTKYLQDNNNIFYTKIQDAKMIFFDFFSSFLHFFTKNTRTFKNAGAKYPS